MFSLMLPSLKESHSARRYRKDLIAYLQSSRSPFSPSASSVFFTSTSLEF